MKKSHLAISLLAVVLSSCGVEEEFVPLDFETFVDAKEDTGYVSNKAAELEATLTSRVYIDMTGKTPEEIQARAENLRTSSLWVIRDYTTPQVKYARNALKSEKLDLNLERGETQVLSTTTDANGVWLEYSSSIESLVKFKELQSKGLTLADLVGKQIEFLLPANPKTVFQKGGLACATDPDGDQLHESDLNPDNYFYYFDPRKPGCPLKEGVDLVTARYRIVSSLDAPSVYPEYDMLTADKKITMVALFGQIEHGELKSNDWGWIGYNEFRRDFEREGFRSVETFPGNFGERLEKTYPGGLLVTVDFYTPEALKDARPRAEVNELFKNALLKNEIVYYNGHAFYGSLTVLDQRDAYPPETYQIIFMDACWSYSYYTKQVFENKADPQKDPDGMRYADVVNNTEPGITGSHKTAWLLYKNVFKAASEYMQGKDVSRYSWNNLIVYMNDSAEQRARFYDPEKFHAEIYGASGVTKNCFDPGGRSRCQEKPQPADKEFAEEQTVEIPDNQPEGISRTIEVPSSFTIRSLSVTLNVRHTYIGDLRITLSHAGKEVVLHDRSGGGADDIRTVFDVKDFSGMDAAGPWVLRIGDHAPYDTGRLESWKLSFTEEITQNVIWGENHTVLSIPDNDQQGVASTISLSGEGTVRGVMVHVNITHSYVGDLLIKLEHAGVQDVLFNHQGGSQANLDSDFSSSAFDGMSAGGDWTLYVYDTEAADTGSLNSWTIRINTGN